MLYSERSARYAHDYCGCGVRFFKCMHYGRVVVRVGVGRSARSVSMADGMAECFTN